MKDLIFYSIEGSAAVHYACEELKKRGICVVKEPTPAVTHLILPIPSFDTNGHIRGAGDLRHILSQLPENVTIIGGNLHHKALDSRNTLDLLQDEQYLAQNAAITADCAMRIAGNNLQVCFRGCKILIVGWGRIGKCLAQLLQSMGAQVHVAARREKDRASLASLGIMAHDPEELGADLKEYRVIFNTAPEMVLDRNKTAFCRHDCVLIDLASAPGLEGENVIVARGLPGKDLPEASGALIAATICRLLHQKGDAL